MASPINVKEPEISAWLAMMAAKVAMAIPKIRNHWGMIA
jgi:hypothetical protein